MNPDRTIDLGSLSPGDVFELPPGRAPGAHVQREKLMYELVAHGQSSSTVVRVTLYEQLELAGADGTMGRRRSKHTERWSAKTKVVPK